MNKNDLIKKVEGIIHKSLNNSSLALSGETLLKDIEGWDSLRHVTVITDVEKAFAISIGFMELLEIKTLDDIYNVVLSKLKH